MFSKIKPIIKYIYIYIYFSHLIMDGKCLFIPITSLFLVIEF